jgi:hypothetical protein
MEAALRHIPMKTWLSLLRGFGSFPLPSPPSPVIKLKRRDRKTEKERQLSDERGEGNGKSLSIREGLVLYNTLNTLWRTRFLLHFP